MNSPQKALVNFGTISMKPQDQLWDLPDTGWEPQINDNCNLEAARMLLNSLLPKDIKLKKFSFSSNPGYFQAVLAQGISEPQQIAAEFRRRTGLELRLSLPNQEPPEPSKPQDLQSFPNPMEQNQALAYLDASLAAMAKPTWVTPE